MPESWWDLPDPPDAKPKSEDERAVTRRREKLMVNPDVKLLVREALDTVKTAVIEHEEHEEREEQVRKERDELRDLVRGQAATINTIRDEFADTLERCRADRDKWEKRAVEWRQHAIDFKEEFGRTVDQATAVLQREAARKGREYTGRKRGRPGKDAPNSCSSSDCSSACSTSEPKRQRKGTPQTQRRVAWQSAISAAAEEAASSKKKLVSLYEQGVPGF